MFEPSLGKTTCAAFSRYEAMKWLQIQADSVEYNSKTGLGDHVSNRITVYECGSESLY